MAMKHLKLSKVFTQISILSL